jgi:hypothetical protein
MGLTMTNIVDSTTLTRYASGVKRLLTVLTFLAACAVAASSQSTPSGGTVTTKGVITPGHCTKFASASQIQDAGGACGTGTGNVSTTPVAGQFITTITPTTAASGFGAGNAACSAFDTNGTTDTECARATNEYTFLATGASSFFRGWNYYYQTDLSQTTSTAIPSYGVGITSILEVPAGGGVANSDVGGEEVVTTVTGGNASGNLYARGIKTRSQVIGSGTIFNGTMIGNTWYLPLLGAGTTNNGQMIGYFCDNPIFTGATQNGIAICNTGGGAGLNVVYLSQSHQSSTGASFAVVNPDPQALCDGSLGGAGNAGSPSTWTNAGCIGMSGTTVTLPATQSPGNSSLAAATTAFVQTAVAAAAPTGTSVAAAQYCADSGAANAIVCAPASPITAYAAGQTFIVKVANTNTTAVTLAVSGLAAKNVTEQGNNVVAFTGGELFINNYYQFTYDGTQFRAGAPIIAESCSWAPGATLDAQIANVLAVTSSGKAVIIDCRDVSGSPTIAANPFASLFGTGYLGSTQGVLFLPCVPITQTAPIVATSGWTINGCGPQIGSNGGTKLVAGTGFQSTYTIGTIQSWTCSNGPPQTCTVVGSGTNWTAGNVKLYSEFTLCSSVGGNGANCTTSHPSIAVAGLISAVNSTTSITVQLTGSLPTNASGLADNYVINACMICMGDESSNGTTPFNFAIQVGGMTLNCGTILGCIPLANYSCSNLCGFDGPMNMSPSNNVGVDLEGNQGQNAAFNTTPPWIACAGHCTATTVGLIVRSGIASPLGLNAWQVAVGFVSGATGVANDSPVWFYDFHVLGSGSGDVFADGTAFVCPTICRMQPQIINGGGVVNLNCPPGSAGTVNCLHIGTNGTPVNYTAMGIKALGSGITNTLKDDNANPAACTISVAAEPTVQQYVVGATSGIRISSSAQSGCTSSFPSLSLAGSSSGSCPLTVSATGGTLNICSADITALAATLTLGVTGTIGGNLTLSGATSGALALTPNASGNQLILGGSGAGGLQAAYWKSTGTKYTQDTGCGTIATSSGGATAGKFTTVGSTSCTTVITFGNSATATNGWACYAHDVTTAADFINPHITASTTQATIVTGTIVSGDVIEFACVGY